MLWVEEPLPGDDRGGMRSLRDVTGMRIAGGEMARTFDELRLSLEQDTLDVYQPDVVLALGISGVRTLAELVAATQSVVHAAHVDERDRTAGEPALCAGLGGGPFIEFPYDPPGWTPERRDFMLTKPLTIDQQGLLQVPDAPGLGVTLDEDAIAKRTEQDLVLR